MLTSAGSEQLTALFGLEGQSAVVTGAAAGIGRSVATLFATAGANVACADIDADRLAATVREINLEAGRTAAIAVPTDISDEAAVRALYAAAASAFNAVTVVANVAGIVKRRAFEELSVEDYDRSHAINSRGTFLSMREAIGHMRAQNSGGSIINISSVASQRAAILHQCHYGASKASVNALTTSLALEVGADNIRINAILPGGIPGERTARENTPAMAPVEGPLAHLERIPLGRYGAQIEIASAVLFLASPAAKYITGQLLAVDGGFCTS